MSDPHSDNLAGRDPSKSGIAKLISWSISNQLIVLTLAAALAISGWLALDRTPLDAVPDLTDTQIIIRTDFPGQSPQIVEDLVTYPLSTNMLGLPKTKDVRGASMFGTSFVYVIFEDDVDLYWARSRVVEALSRLGSELPPGAVPQIGPDATGVGWVYQYALVDKTGGTDLAQLRSLQDWFLKLELAGVEGVSEVASVGGFVREYQVLIDPNRLRAYDVPLRRISEVVTAHIPVSTSSPKSRSPRTWRAPGTPSALSSPTSSNSPSRTTCSARASAASRRARLARRRMRSIGTTAWTRRLRRRGKGCCCAM